MTTRISSVAVAMLVAISGSLWVLGTVEPGQPIAAGQTSQQAFQAGGANPDLAVPNRACAGIIPLAATAALSVPGVPDPVAHWAFEEGTGPTAHDSAGGNDGTLVGGPAWAEGRVGGGLSFDGVDDYIDLGKDTSLKVPHPFTIAAWIKIGDDFTATKGVLSLDTWLPNYNGAHLAVLASERALINFGDGVGGSPNHRRGWTGDTVLSQDTWYHVAGVVAGPNSMRMYIDGVDDGGGHQDSRYIGPVGYGDGNSAIGNRVDGAIAFFKGTLDEVMVFDRALTPVQVDRLYAAGLPRNEFAAEMILDAIQQKAAPIREIEAALRSERLANSALKDFLDAGDFGDLTKPDVVEALRQLRTAIRTEERALDHLNRSVAGLLAALDALGWEPDLPAPIGYWAFEEGGGGVACDSAGANDGALVGGPTWTMGRVGGALSFDGVDDFVDLGRAASLEVQYPLTIAAWVKLSTDLDSLRAVVSIDTWAPEYNGVHLAVGDSERPVIQFGDGIGGAPWHRRQWLGNSVLDPGTWHHIAGVITGPNSMQMYVDGFDHGGGYNGSTYVGPIAYAGGDSAIGDIVFNKVGNFPGAIDELMIFDQALTAEEVWLLHLAAGG